MTDLRICTLPTLYVSDERFDFKLDAVNARQKYTIENIAHHTKQDHRLYNRQLVRLVLEGMKRNIVTSDQVLETLNLSKEQLKKLIADYQLEPSHVTNVSAKD